MSMSLRQLLAVIFALVLVTLGQTNPAAAANPTPVQYFYVPFPEDQLLAGLQAIELGGSESAPVDPVQTYISIAAIANDTIVYYDQWENGYDADISNPVNLYNVGNLGGTQIWGDADAANGAPPGIPSDVINAGTVIILQNAVTTTNLLAIDFDGGDKFAATKTIAVTRVGYAAGPNSLLAGAVEVFDTTNWGLDHRAPVGQDIPSADDHQMFQYTGLAILAGEQGATIQIDADANGVFETTQTLTEGQSYFVNGGVNVGGRVLSDELVQVDMLTGDIASNYESRDSELLPISLWFSDYYTPVSTSATAQSIAGTATTVWLYNPDVSAITVQYQTRNGLGNLTTTPLTVPGGPQGGYLSQVIPDGYGAHFSTSGAKFYPFSTTNSTDTDTDGNQAWDWGFTLIPKDSLTSQALIGLGIGRDPTSGSSPSQDGNPIWVTPVGNGDTPVTVYVDFDANPATGALTDPNGNKYDLALSLKELERAKVYDTTDGDQTGTLVYALATGVKLAVAWGQDPQTASAGAPGLDVGTGVPPAPEFSAGKNGVLYTDTDGDGFVSPGDVLLYTIAIDNVSRAPVPDVLLQDTVPVDTTYVPNTTFFTNASNVTTQIPDNGVGTAFPLDGSGIILDSITALPVGGSYVVTFRVTIDSFPNLTPGTTEIINLGSVSAVGETTDLEDHTPLHGRIGDFVWTDSNGNGLQDVNEPGVNGVTVRLLDGLGNVLATTTTANNGIGDPGYYTFTGLLAGSYIVEFVAPGGYTFTVQNADAQGLNGAVNSDANITTGRTVVFALAAGQTNMNADAGFFIPNPLIDIVKSFVWTTGDGDQVGDIVTFTFTVTNTGSVTLNPVTVTDDQFGPITLLATSLAPGAFTTGTATLTLTQALLDAGSHTNIATAHGTPPIGPDVTDTDTRTVTFTETPSIHIAKTFEWTTGNGSQVGDVVTFTFTVTNTGNVTLNPVTVNDDQLGPITLLATSLAPGASTTGTATLTLTQALLDAGSHTNIATATGTPPSGPDVTDPDTLTVTFTETPSISIQKTFAWTTGDGSQVGHEVTYTYTVTNTGNVTLNPVTVSDDQLGPITLLATSLAPGAFTTGTATLTVTQALIDSVSQTNIATATGTPPTGPDVTDTDSETVDFILGPHIDIEKTFAWTTGDGSQVGDIVTFTFTVTNTGNVTLNPVTVSDDQFGPITLLATSLAPGAFTTGTATLTLTQVLLDAGTHTNIATATGTPPTGPDVTDDDTQIVTFTTTPSIHIAKSFEWTTGFGDQVGDIVTFTFTVTNTGNVTLDPVTVNDDQLGPITLLDTNLAPGEMTTGTATLTLTQELLDAGTHTNIATATGTPPSGPDVTDEDTQIVTFNTMPSIHIAKSFEWTTGDGSQVGDIVTFTYTVTNTGNVTLDPVTVSDDQLGPITLLATSLAPGASTTGTATLTVTQALLDAGSHTNIATATGTPPTGPDVTDPDEKTVTFAQTPGISLVKYVSVDGGATWHDANAAPGIYAITGQPVQWKYVITNVGNVTLSSLTLIDSVIGPIILSPTTLAPQAAITVYQSGTVINGQYTNVATVTGTPSVGDNVQASDPANYFGEDASISVVKSVSTTASGPWDDANSPPGPQVTVGSDVYFQFVITNTGSVPLSGVTLTDSVYNAGSTPPFVPTPPIPDPLATSATYTYVYGPVTATAGFHTDIATATGTTTGGTDVTDSDPAHFFDELPPLLQAYPGDSGGTNTAFAGYLASPGEVISSVPGVFVIVPQNPGDPAWANYVQAFQDEVDYTLKDVTLCKTHPDIIQCADVFPSGVICQQGTPNIRLHWPLMYEVPGTTWTLTILYGTGTPYDPDGPGPEPLGYVHTQVWTWQVDATVQSMKDLLELFHETPFGLDEVPLISDEALYPILQAKLDAIQDALDMDPQDLVGAGQILGDFEMEVMDACIATSPARPNPTGNGTGIAQTFENPGCCKLMVDSEYIGFQLGVFQPVK